MKIVVSPAKSLDFETTVPTDRHSQLLFEKEATTLSEVLKKKRPVTLSKLMGISPKLAELNWQRNQDFAFPFTTENARQAVYAFSGDVYQGLDAYSLPADKHDALQDTLRILSGQYGLLKPFDLMQPYRLEMGTKMTVNRKPNLYKFWGDKITDALNDELEDGELFLNLASNEYFGAVNTKKLKVPVVTPIFKDWKGDKLKVISFFAKKARGAMVRYILDNQVQDLDGVTSFDVDGYGYSEQYTTNAMEPVFVR